MSNLYSLNIISAIVNIDIHITTLALWKLSYPKVHFSYLLLTSETIFFSVHWLKFSNFALAFFSAIVNPLQGNLQENELKSLVNILTG